MNKKIIAIIIIILCIFGVYLYGTHKELTLNDYFVKSDDYTSTWNNVSKEISVQKEFPLKFNQTYENVATEVTFYIGNKVLNSTDVVNDTHNGKLTVNVTMKLTEEPTGVDFNIYNGDLIESDIEGLEYGEKFHLI